MFADLKKRFISKEQIVCYSVFILEVTGVVLCFTLKINSWTDSIYITAGSAILFSGIILFVLLAVSLLVCIYFKQLAIEKKILIMLSSIAIALGVLGFTDLVFENKLTFIDTIYKSIQLFVGEFEYTALSNNPVPPMINAARFLALFVTFGTIFTIILKQKIYYMNIKLFYRDVVIISNEPEGYIADLANKFVADNRKVLIAYTKETDVQNQITSGEIPVVSIDIKKNMKIGLKTCNVKNAKSIYLLCDATSENVELIKSIYTMLNIKKKNNEQLPIVQKDVQKQNTINELIKEYRKLLLEDKRIKSLARNKAKSRNVSCYIQYQTDEERKYYSIDEVFTNRTDDFTTYFINRYDISIRQMLSKSNVTNSIDFGEITIDKLKDNLNDINIAVSGSGEMLDRTIIEIAKNCVYNNVAPFKIYLIELSEENFKIPQKLQGLVAIEKVSVKDFAKSGKKLNQFFISSRDEKEIQALLEKIFQYDMQEKIFEYLILTDGNVVEYDILKNYIKGLLSLYARGQKKFVKGFNPSIYLSNIKDLIPTVNKFYQNYAPTGREIFDAYKNAIVDDELLDFNNLPERFIDSNILSALHNNFILDIVDRWVDANEILSDKVSAKIFNKSLEELLIYLAMTEHERWYNERTLQGFIYSKEKSQLYNKNANLLHWDKLSNKQKDISVKYVISTLIAQYKKPVDNEDIYENVISKFDFKSVQGD